MLGYTSWTDYYNRGIIPNIWKGITGQKSADINTQKTNESNEKIAQQNLDFQRENLEYQKALQQQIFEREDTSYQRTAQDMLNAGLNPLTMQGTNGAGEAVSTSPLNNSMQYQQTPQAFQNGLNSLFGFVETLNSLRTGMAERDSIMLENDRKRLENKILAHDYGLDFFGKGKNRYIGQSYLGNYDFNWNNSKGWKNNFNIGSSNKSWYEGENLFREYEHKVNANIYDTDLKEERILTALTDWIDNGRMDRLMESMKKYGFKTFGNLFN